MKRKTIQGKEIIYLEVMYIVSGTKPFLMAQIKDINKILYFDRYLEASFHNSMLSWPKQLWRKCSIVSISTMNSSIQPRRKQRIKTNSYFWLLSPLYRTGYWTLTRHAQHLCAWTVCGTSRNQWVMELDTKF